MEPDSLSIQELSDLTGIEPRTIRSYVERGVIPGLVSMARGARYPRESGQRLQVFRLLRDASGFPRSSTPTNHHPTSRKEMPLTI